MPNTSSDGLGARFAAWRSSHHKALVPYITAGYPTAQHTLDLMHSCARAGADVIELGVPFSDPVADGPTIQRASQIALEHNTTLEWVLETLSAFRATSDTAVVIFSYLNPVFSYGWQDFIDDAVAAGAQGVLLTDLPVGGDEQLESAVKQSPLDLIRLIAPTTTGDRVGEIARAAQGFLYYIARMGVTGARSSLPEDLDQQLASLRRLTDLPVCVGFGISTAEQAQSVARSADGVVIGSALIDALDAGGTPQAESLLSAMRAAIDKI